MDFDYNIIDDKVLNEKFTSSFRSAYINIEEATLPVRFADFYNQVKNLAVYDDDVWICSFPKTGTTWSQEMIWMIANNVDYEQAKIGLGERFPFLDYSILFDYRKLMENNQEFNPPEFLIDSVSYVEGKNRPRFVKTHLPWNLLPNVIQSGLKSPKIIHVCRNPKDTCVSYYHHCRLLEGYTGNFAEFTQLFFEGKLCFAPYWSNVLPFWQRRHEPNVLFLKYEDLKSNLKLSVQRVARFLGKTLSDVQMQGLLEHLSFHKMKDNPAVNYQALLDFNKKFKLSLEDGSFMRSGVVGSHKVEMSDELGKKFNSWMRNYDPNNELGYRNS